LKGFIEINRELCKECLLCVEACKRDNIVPSTDLNAKGYHPVRFTADGRCNGCALCATVCPEAAIEVWRE